MDAKAAVRAAKRYISEMLEGEGVLNLGLEELEFDGKAGVWLVTLGFSRPWNTVKNALTSIAGEMTAKRAYRVIAISNETGAVLSMKRRDVLE